MTAGRSPQKRGFSVFGGTQCHERGRAYGGWNDPSKMITQRAPTPNCNSQLTCKPSHTPSWQKLFNRELVWYSLICVDRTGTTTQKMICMDLHVSCMCSDGEKLSTTQTNTSCGAGPVFASTEWYHDIYRSYCGESSVTEPHVAVPEGVLKKPRKA